MENLAVRAGDTTPTRSVNVAVTGVTGQPVAWLEWDPPRPGTVLFWKMVPIMAAVSVIFVIAFYWGARVLRDKATNLIAKEAASFDQARKDVLTGLPNRFALREHLEHVTHNTSKDCAVLAIDLDRFKQINDTVGHIGGDIFLETFGARLSDLIDRDTFIARLGGDEFVLVISGNDRLIEIVEEKCVRLAALSRKQITCNGVLFDVMTAKGLSVMQADELRPDELLRRADRAMYVAKSRGTQKVIPYDKKMEHKDQEYKLIESHLRRALVQGDDFHMVYQPIVATDVAEGYNRFEALARWTDPDLGEVPPEKFIEVAETSGLIVRFGWMILDLVCQDIRRLENCVVGLNVSPLQLMTPGFANLFAARVAENRCAA